MTESQLDGELVTLAIENGMCDNDLDHIIEVARARRDTIRSRAALALERDDEFYIINISPKYLAGLRVRVLRHDGQWVVCEWVSPHPQRYSNPVKLRHSHVGRIITKDEIEARRQKLQGN